MFISIDFYFQMLSLLLAMFFYKQKRNKIQRYFIPFLFLTVVVEFIGWLRPFHGYGKFAMYNIFTAFEFVFYASLFYIHFRSKKLKTLVLLFIPFFLCAVVLNILFLQGFNTTLNTYTLLLGSFFIVIFCCCFFYESILPDQIDQQLSKQPFFWICSGLLLFYLGTVIINALFEYLLSNNLQEEVKRIYGIIIHSLNVILYSSFCIAFYLCPNNSKRSSLRL